MNLNLARCLCSLTQAHQIFAYGCITMRHVVYILDLSMTSTFDLYVGGGGDPQCVLLTVFNLLKFHYVKNHILYYTKYFVLCIKKDKICIPVYAVTFEDDRCWEPYNPTPQKSFEVNHTGGIDSFVYKDMTFSGQDDEDSVTREVCVKVFFLECSQTLEYRAGTNRGNADKTGQNSYPLFLLPIYTFKYLLWGKSAMFLNIHQSS